MTEKPASINTAPRPLDMSYETLMEDYDFIKGEDPNQASLYYTRLSTSFKEKNPDATADQLDQANEQIARNLTGNVRGGSEIGSIAADPNSEATLKNQEAFAAKTIRTRQSDFDTNKLAEEARTNQERVLTTLDELTGVQEIASLAPEKAAEGFNDWQVQYEERAEKAGIPKEEIAETVNRGAEATQDSALDALIDNDPEEALAQMKESNMGNSRAEAKAGSIVKQEQKEEAEEQKAKPIRKSSRKMAGLSLGEIQKLERTEGPVGVAARKSAKAIQKDPFKYAESSGLVDFSTLNVNDPGTLEDRTSDTERASDILGTEVPILAKAEVTRIKANFKDSAATQRFTELAATAPVDVRSQMSEQLGTSAQAFAVRLGEDDGALVRDILNGANAPVKGIASDERLNMYPFDSILNVQSNKAVDALVKSGEHTVEEARKEIYNVQEIGESFLGFGGYELPLPRGVDADEFERVGSTLLENPARLAEFGNGVPSKLRTSTGKVVSFDSDDLEWIPVGQGTYGLKDEDDKLIKTEDGTLFEVDMERALGEI